MKATACIVWSLTAQTTAIGFQGNCSPSPPRNGSAKVQATAKASACAVDRPPPPQRHDGRGEADGEGKEQRQPQHRRHGVDAEPLGVGEEGDAHPVKAGKKKAETERGAAEEGSAGSGRAMPQDRHQHAETRPAPAAGRAAAGPRPVASPASSAASAGRRSSQAGMKMRIGWSASGGVVVAAAAGMRRIRTRLIRRGSASSTSNSRPPGWVTISPRVGTRSTRVKISPPNVSASSRSSPSSSGKPSFSSSSSR